MALPLPPGLLPSEVNFLCEMELVTVVPRQRLDPIELLSGKTPALRPPYRADIPLWLALLLKKQRRANIVPPPWLHPSSLGEIVHHETHVDPGAFSAPPPVPSRADPSNPGTARVPVYGDAAMTLSPPFVPSNTSSAPANLLPYHWFEMSEVLLAHAGDDIPASGEVRRLVRDLQEVRAAKMREGMVSLGSGGGVTNLKGVGGMELAEGRGFILGVVDGVRRIGAGAEVSRREEEEEQELHGRAGGGRGDEEEDEEDDDDDEDMGF
ncbi:hypothetical protein MKZ38_007524 [Zalerion maritima]|uniref:DNA replication complex GINS protein PSF2 n=1 Tax=Zalerion maritima TaxID=339359 RepID=A0AAD5WN79_9PEZI|nr:hypothetical protein MKZ38_007524 [Zalerion maritima]